MSLNLYKDGRENNIKKFKKINIYKRTGIIGLKKKLKLKKGKVR